MNNKAPGFDQAWLCIYEQHLQFSSSHVRGIVGVVRGTFIVEIRELPVDKGRR